MDNTKKTITISALLLSSVTLLTLGLYLKAMNTDMTASTPPDQGMAPAQMEIMAEEETMPGMSEEMMAEEATMPMNKNMQQMPMMQQETMMAEEEMPAPETNAADTELSEAELNAILEEIANMPEDTSVEAPQTEEAEAVAVEETE